MKANPFASHQAVSQAPFAYRKRESEQQAEKALARLSYRLAFVLEATASASLDFAIAHDWYMDLFM